MRNARGALVALALVLAAPVGAQETADSLIGLPGVEVSIIMRSNVELVAPAMTAKLRNAGIPMVAGAPAQLRLDAQVARSEAPGVAAFMVELHLTQLVDVRANGRRALVPTWNRRRLGLATDERLTSEVQSAVLGLVDEFVKAWASVNVR